LPFFVFSFSVIFNHLLQGKINFAEGTFTSIAPITAVIILNNRIIAIITQ